MNCLCIGISVTLLGDVDLVLVYRAFFTYFNSMADFPSAILNNIKVWPQHKINLRNPGAVGSLSSPAQTKPHKPRHYTTNPPRIPFLQLRHKHKLPRRTRASPRPHPYAGPSHGYTRSETTFDGKAKSDKSLFQCWA